MAEFLLKVLPVFLTITVISMTLNWISRGSGNLRIYISGLIPVLLALGIVGFDLTRKRYNESDYTIEQVTVKGCRIDKLGNGIITASDGASYPFDRSLLWQVGNAPELANLLCHQKNLKLWVRNGSEVSAFESENFSIPIETGIVRDDSDHSFLAIAFVLGMTGLALIGIAFRHDRMGKKVNLKF